MSKIRYANWFASLKFRQWLGLDKRFSMGDLLVALRDERAAIGILLDQMHARDLELPGVEGNWSVKDVLAHLAAWDRRGLHWIEAADAGRMPQMPEPGLRWDAIDRLNAQTTEANKNRPFAEVYADFEGSYQALVDFIDRYPAESSAHPVVAELITWRYKHYHRHAESIWFWLRNRMKSPGRGAVDQQADRLTIA